MKIKTLAITLAACTGFTAATMFAVALAQQPAPPPQQMQSIEERMVADTSAVLGVLRTWHNQISQDQQYIASLQKQLQTISKERDDLKQAEPPNNAASPSAASSPSEPSTTGTPPPNKP